MRSKITINDIARMAGVSKATVSMVFNNKDQNISRETREKILKIAKELNYIPNSIAKSLITNRTYSIGIILPDITNPFFSEIARAIEDEANLMGYNIILCNTDNDVKKEEQYVKILISKLVDGVIFIASGHSTKALKLIKENNKPFVLVDRHIKSYKNHYGVYCKNAEGVIKGIQYLCSIGRKKIVFVNGPENLDVSLQRLEGYKKIMTEYGIFSNKYIFSGDFSLEGGKSITEKILNTIKDFDAIFYSNDIMAIGGMKILLKKGYKIPEDVNIIGFDNIKITQFIEPELTTIAQPIYEMGREACRLLVRVVNREEIDNKIIYFEPSLIIRGTTG